MSSVWKRPSELKFPAQYYKFVVRDKDTNELVEYTVKDIPESRYEEASRFMIKYFVPYEPKLVARNGQNDPDVIDDCFARYLHGLRQKVSVACFKDGSEDFVAINILEVLGKNDPPSHLKFKSKTYIDNEAAVDFIVNQADIFNRHNVDYYVSGTGLAIDPAYRNMGIATEIIKGRRAILDFFNLKVFSTGFTSIGAQKAASKAGQLTDYAITYKDLAKVNPDWDFCGTDNLGSYIQMSICLRS